MTGYSKPQLKRKSTNVDDLIQEEKPLSLFRRILKHFK